MGRRNTILKLNIFFVVLNTIYLVAIIVLYLNNIKQIEMTDIIAIMLNSMSFSINITSLIQGIKIEN